MSTRTMTSEIATAPTRERLLDAALDLFAERGFDRTTVGDIEAAAGLSPRAGGLYKHFPSKESLLEAALERFVVDTEAVEARVLEPIPLDDLRSELTWLAHTAMRHFRAQRGFLRIIFQEGGRFPAVVATMHRRAVAPAYAAVATWIRGQSAAGTLRAAADPEALAAVLTMPFVGYRLEENLFGVPPGGIGEDRYVAAWVDLVMTLATKEEA